MCFAFPAFGIGVGITVVQLGVSSVNHHRAKNELRLRLEQDPTFQKWYDEHKNKMRAKDISVGLGIKVFFTLLSLRIVGGSEALEAIVTHSLATFSGTAAAHSADAAFYCYQPGSDVPVDSTAGTDEHHAKLMKADAIIHKLCEAPEKMAELLDPCRLDTTYEQLAVMLKSGGFASDLRLLENEAAIGAFAEPFQPIAQLTEWRVCKSMETADAKKYADEKSVEKALLVVHKALCDRSRGEALGA